MAWVAILRHPLPPRSLVHHFQNPSKGGCVTAAQSFTETPPHNPTRSRYPRAPFGSRRPNSPIPPPSYPSISSGYTVAFRAFCGALNAQDSGVLVTTAQLEGCVCCGAGWWWGLPGACIPEKSKLLKTIAAAKAQCSAPNSAKAASLWTRDASAQAGETSQVPWRAGYGTRGPPLSTPKEN